MGLTKWFSSGVMQLGLCSRTTRIHEETQNLTPPFFVVRAPAVDIRAGTVVALENGDFSRPLSSVSKRIDLYAPGSDPDIDVSFAHVEALNVAPTTTLEYTVPSGVSDHFLVGRVTAVDDLGRPIATVQSDQATVVATNIPRNTTPPSQNGTGYVAEIITLDKGVWENASSVRTILTIDQVEVLGTEDTVSYTPALADLGLSFRWNVWADGFKDETVISTNPTQVKVHALRTAAPSISGTGNVGDPLTRVLGVIIGTPTPQVVGNWQRDGVAVAGANGATYTPTANDSTHQFSWRDYAAGYESSTAAVSNIIGVKTSNTDPFNIIAPSLAGAAVEGSTMTRDIGSWGGTPAPMILSNFQLDGVDISGATGSTYVTQHADVGKSLRCAVWASGFKALTLVYTNSITVTAAAVTFPSFLKRADWKAIQDDIPNHGSRQLLFGKNAGSANNIVIPSAFSLYGMGSTNPITANTVGLATQLVDPVGSDVIDLNNGFSDGTVFYHAPVWHHNASGQRQIAHDPADTVTVGNTTAMYGFVVISSATAGVHNLSDFIDAVTTIGSGGGTIVLAPDFDAPEFVWPVNRSDDASINTPLIIQSANQDRPGIFRGIAIAPDKLKGNFAHLTLNGKASSVKGIQFDWCRFEATRLTMMREKGTKSGAGIGNGPTHDLVAAMGDGSGIGWWCCGCPEHPAAPYVTYGENGVMQGLLAGGGVKGLKATNCTFNGFGNAINMGGDNILISQCLLYENAEDIVRVSGGNNNTVEWIWTRDFRALDLEPAKWFGYTDANDKPPHADNFQSTLAGDNITIRYCYLDDKTTRVHFALLNAAKGKPGGNSFQGNLTVLNNQSRQSHRTGLIVSFADGLTVTQNDFKGFSDSYKPGIQLTSSGAPANKGTKVITNNQAPNFDEGISANSSNGNTETNNRNTTPPNFVPIRKDDPNRATNGRYVGPGGNGT